MNANTVTIVVVAALAVFLLVAGWADFRRWKGPMDSVRKGVVTEQMLNPLGIVKATGAAGLIVGLWIPGIGIAAAACLVVYFVLAIGAHLRKKDSYIWPALGYLALSVAALVLFVR